MSYFSHLGRIPIVFNELLGIAGVHFLPITQPKVSKNWRNCSIKTLSLRFSGHFPGVPGLAGVYWSKWWFRWWQQLDYWSYKSCKAPVKSSPPTSSFFTGRMPFLSPNQQCQCTEGNVALRLIQQKSTTQTAWKALCRRWLNFCPQLFR